MERLEEEIVEGISMLTHILIFHITGSSDHLANVLEDVWGEL